jgi:hypothetical protein
MAPHLQRFSFSFCDCPLWLAMSRLQSGSGRSGMGFNGHFAQRQFLETDVRDGSKADIALGPRHVRFTPESGHSPTRSGCLLWAISGLMHCSKQHLYSITSSARASSEGGTVRPSALAVLRLITSSNLVGACTGRAAGFSPLRMRST